MRTVTKIWIIALLAGISGKAQTVNAGQMSIMPNTIVSTVADFDNKGTLTNDGIFYVYANFNNDNIVNFNVLPGSVGWTRFENFPGSSPAAQTISGSNQSQFQRVYFVNDATQPAFHLSGDISIAEQANFNRGIVDNDNYGGKITFEQDGTHIDTWNGSHVDGKVIKNGNTDFVYPIGDKNLYRYAQISAPAETVSQFIGKYFYENSNPLYPHASKQKEIGLINDQEYWTVTKDGGTSDVLLTLSWDETETTPAAVIAAPESDIHIVRWDATNSIWVDQGGVADLNNKTVTTSVEVTGYGVFTLARVATDKTCVEIFNAVTPNNDNVNDFFEIDCLENYPDNTVTIFNRWGVKVFETSHYGNKSTENVFTGYSDGRTTVEGNKSLPTGTYFYVLSYKSKEPNVLTHKKAGYLYLKVD